MFDHKLLSDAAPNALLQNLIMRGLLFRARQKLLTMPDTTELADDIAAALEQRHPFSSGPAAASFHVSADHLSPAEAMRDPMPEAWQIIIAMICGSILGAAGWFAAGWFVAVST
ncbi:hypothetical protein [Paracoccus aestuariivivens]|uniref:Uncharacterized protein n=1 Tax=Paracoccus aestuariivivens TaxID=1820333 RepID=A0A6L6J449_9RHOB|nr:hypothetical protein [Paracoccus aestuariivivens]MTH76336.1 hypothetical protein [Paracoccus aestuariivivens]